MIETAGESAVVRLTLRYSFSAGGRVAQNSLSTLDVTIAAGQMVQIGEMSRTIIGPDRDDFGDLRNMQLDVEVTAGSGRVLPFLQTIDNGSGDLTIRTE